MQCQGNPLDICGGNDFYSVYATTKSGIISQSIIPTDFSKWKSQGCLSDPSGNVLIESNRLVGLNTIYKCFAFCQQYWHIYAGLRNGKECCKFYIFVPYHLLTC